MPECPHGTIRLWDLVSKDFDVWYAWNRACAANAIAAAGRPACPVK